MGTSETHWTSTNPSTQPNWLMMTK